MKERFIAVNILPPRRDYEDAFTDFQRWINEARELNFNYVWLNPICSISKNSSCTRRDLDIGILTTQYRSLYDYDDPSRLNSFFVREDVQTYIKSLKDERFHVLVDFAWMFVGNFKVFDQKKWTRAKSQETPIAQEKEIVEAKAVIDFYLNTLGFSGLRIDGASHIHPEVRIELYSYIRERYPEAVIFEEVLFAGNEAQNIQKLVERGHEEGIYSDFVTSNIFYKRPGELGYLPLPGDMGDSVKLQLARGNEIGFTGNHDHHSVGWCTILYLAAKRIVEEGQDFIKLLPQIKTLGRTTGDKEDIDHFSDFKELLDSLINGRRTIEGISDETYFLRLLLPFALEMAKELIEDQNETLLQEFRKIVMEKIIDRTLTSPSGYFFLFCELDSVFQTQRIFTNKNGEPLLLPIMTAEDLIDNDKIIARILVGIQNDMKVQNQYSPNLVNLAKIITLPGGDTLGKKAKKVGRKKKQSEEPILDKNEMRIFLPYVLEYLRNNPDVLKKEFGLILERTLEGEKQLLGRLDLKDFIKQINNIYSQLHTMTCCDYQTFIAQDCFKIIIRPSSEHTDIIVMKTAPGQYEITIADMEKIALWYQARCCSPDKTGCSGSLAEPFDGNEVTNYSWEYGSFWSTNNSEMFNNSYMCILGLKEGHETTLYLGGNISARDKELLFKDSQGNVGTIKVVLGFDYTQNLGAKETHLDLQTNDLVGTTAMLIKIFPPSNDYDQGPSSGLLSNTDLGNEEEEIEKVKELSLIDLEKFNILQVEFSNQLNSLDDPGQILNNLMELIQQDIRVLNLQGNYGQTALHIAALHGDLKIVKSLLRWGADPTVLDKNNKAPHEMAATKEVEVLLSQAFEDKQNKYKL